VLHPRNLLILAGVLLLVIGGWLGWRASQPPLSDEEQIAAQVEGFRSSIESRNARYVTSYLAPGFTWSGMRKSELQTQVALTFTQWRDVTANITGLQITVNGDTATSTGKYSLTLRPHPRGPAEAYLGDFKAFWTKQDGEWKISKIEGTVPQE
jgi:ketosteroid isomerase-like protein